MAVKPLALLSNDDGHDSPGLRALAEAIVDDFEVVVVAPFHEQSAMSHALSLHRPLRAREQSPAWFSVDGTPADCVYVALHTGTRFLPRRPDIVLSGINRGLNLGQDAFYSGTVAAAREAALRGIPAMALSVGSFARLGDMQPLVRRLARSLHERTPRHGVLLGLNVPAAWNGGLTVRRLGRRLYDEIVEVRADPRGQDYFWLGGPNVEHAVDPGSDTEAHDAGLATLSPLLLDLTASGDLATTQQLVDALALPPLSEDPS